MTLNAILLLFFMVMLTAGIAAWVAAPRWRQNRIVRGAIVIPLLILGPLTAYGLLVAWVMSDAT